MAQWHIGPSQPGYADVCDGKEEEHRVLDSSQTRVTIVRRYNKTFRNVSERADLSYVICRRRSS